jgi:integrase
MRGSLRERSDGSWEITLELGYVPDATTGKPRRVRKFVTFHGTRREAEGHLTDLLHGVKHGTFVEPDKRTVGMWLDEWVDLAIKPPRRTQRAYDTYQSVIRLHLKPALGDLRLQGLRAIDVERFLAEKSHLAPATLEKIFIVLSSALKAAAKNSLVPRNVASLVANRPQSPDSQGHAVSNCWTADEAASFLAVAKEAGAQAAALWTLAIDTGMRKSELAGLRWADVDLAQGRVLVNQQLLSGGLEPVFVPTKGKRARAIDVASETIELLRTHKAHQASLKMRYRQNYHDFGLTFAKEWSEGGRRHDVLGAPLDVNNIADRQFDDLISEAGVRRITVHGLRHTCASLLLSAGVSPNVVRDRLGHRKVETTLTVYAHCLPGQQRDAAMRLASLLHRAK